jgi:hypothetical protein
MEGQNFNAEAFVTNLKNVEALIRRIRQKEAVGSTEDELTLCRMTLDLKFLIDVVETQQRANAILQAKVDGKDQSVF